MTIGTFLLAVVVYLSFCCMSTAFFSMTLLMAGSTLSYYSLAVYQLFVKRAMRIGLPNLFKLMGSIFLILFLKTHLLKEPFFGLNVFSVSVLLLWPIALLSSLVTLKKS